MNEALLAVLSALVAALVWLVKAMQSRSDRLIEQRDKEVAKLIKTLEKAVDAFAAFELEGVTVFGKLVYRMEVTQQIQEQVLAELRAMRERLPPVARRGQGA